MKNTSNPYDYDRIQQITFKSLKDGRLTKEDIDVMVAFYRDKEDYRYCNALENAYKEWDENSNVVKEIWAYQGRTKN